jgi:uncharacterized protein YcfJ
MMTGVAIGAVTGLVLGQVIGGHNHTTVYQGGYGRPYYGGHYGHKFDRH